MSKITLTVGFVPVDWQSASDGSKKILIGDIDHSKTIEMVYAIGDDDWKNITTSLILSGEMNDIYKQISNESKELSGGVDRLISQIIKNIYELCLDEAEHQDSFIAIFEENKDFFLNNKNKFNGCFYCYYVTVDEHEELETEKLFVIKRK